MKKLFSKQKNQYVKRKNSSIHHKGVFATKDIPKGTYVIEYVGEKITKEESDRRADETLQESHDNVKKGAVYIFELDKKYDLDGDVSYNLAKYINHSCEPNCESQNIDGHIWIIASRDIKKGEEITYDYGYDIDDYENHPCRCGAPSCPGYIVSADKRDKLRRILQKKKKEENKNKK
jgi:SET domain-containing protein